MGVRIVKLGAEAAVLLMIYFFVHGCCATMLKNEAVYTFENGYGSTITLSPQGATIDGKLYRSVNCSTTRMKCTKYGALFAIMAPVSCPVKDGAAYAGYVPSVRSFIISFTPHDPSSVQLSTSYGGGLSFGYQGNMGVTNLYYDPSTRLGDKDIWLRLGHIDLKKVRYKKVGSARLFACS